MNDVKMIWYEMKIRWEAEQGQYQRYINIWTTLNDALPIDSIIR